MRKIEVIEVIDVNIFVDTSRPSILLAFTASLCTDTGTIFDGTKIRKETLVDVLDSFIKTSSASYNDHAKFWNKTQKMLKVQTFHKITILQQTDFTSLLGNCVVQLRTF